MWAPSTHEFIFPSDPIIWTFWGRWIAVNGHWALFIRNVTDGFIMTQSFGFHYWLGFLFSYNLSSSYDIMRFAGPFFGVFNLLSIYELVRKMTKSRVASFFSMLLLETSYLWMWAQRLTTEYTTIGFMLPLTMLLLYDYFERGKNPIDLYVFFIIVGGLWLYHPPTALLSILPVLLCYLLKWRKIIKFNFIVKGGLLFFILTSIYWVLLNSNSFAERLKTIPIASQTNLFSPEILVQNALTPFEHTLGLIPIIPLILVLISISYGFNRSKYNYSANTLIFQLILTLFLLEYFYWIFPSPAMRIIISQTYSAERMPLHLAVPISILGALGYERLLDLLKKICNVKNLYLKVGTYFDFKINKYFRIALIIFLIFLTSIQFYWGYLKFNTYSQFYSYSMTNDGARMVKWIDQNLPLNCTILIDEPTTIDYQNISEYGTHGSIRNINSRGNGWLAFASLYPRDILGDPIIFEEAKAYIGKGFIDFLKKYDVNYILITNPSKYPILILALSENLVHREGNVSLFLIPFLDRDMGDSVIEYNQKEGTYIVPICGSFRLKIPIQDVGWKDESFMEGWSEGGPLVLSNGSIAQLTYKNVEDFTVWARTDKLIFPTLCINENGYRYLFIRLFVVEQKPGDYLSIYVRDEGKRDQLVAVLEYLPKETWITYLIDLQNGYSCNKLRNASQVSIVLRTGSGNTQIIKIDFIIFANLTSVK
jgi:hypothetical protein